MIDVEILSGKAIAGQHVEIVERKGKGHPDTMCDSIMEAISVALSGAYLEEFGAILHHNIDKGLLAAGRVEKWFGGGRVVQPMELIIGDRATFAADGRSVPVADIAISAARQWIRNNMRLVDPEHHLTCCLVLAPGSEELTGIFGREGKVRAANDTSAAVGYYPLTPAEQAVLAVEGMLNSAHFKERYPQTGEDIKVMGLRTGRHFDVTVAMPLLAEYIRSEREYFTVKEAVRREIEAFLREDSAWNGVSVNYNTLDREGTGLAGVYLSLLGTSAEDADSGQVGRGNRVNGVIAVGRPLGTEAAAGKNPVSHVGKVYNVMSHRLAQMIYQEIEGLQEVHVYLLSKIGMPVDAPYMTAVQVIPERDVSIGSIRRSTEEICRREFSKIEEFCMQLARGEFPVC